MATRAVMGLVLAGIALAQPVAGRAQDSVSTGSIAGLVTTTAGTPLGRVVVSLDGQGVGAGLSTVTGDDGHYRLQQVPAGYWRVVATRAGYLPAAYGALVPGGRGAEVVVNAGQAVSDVSLAMTRGGVIAGVVRDRLGRPKPGVRVRALASAGVSALLRLPPSATATSREDGSYRVFGLPAGRYLVEALEGSLIQQGGLVETPGASQIDRLLSELEARQARGTGLTVEANRPTPPTTITVAPVYFPGTLDASEAVPVPLAPESELANVDLVWVSGRSVAVAGTIAGLSADGLAVTVELAPSAPVAGIVGRSQVAQATADGHFRFPSVLPGQYALQATLRTAGTPYASATAEATVSVGAVDITAVALTMTPTPQLKGRLVLADGTPLVVGTSSRVAFTDVSAFAEGRRAGMARPVSTEVVVGTDGTFLVPRIVPGTYDVRASAPPALQAVVRAGEVIVRDRRLDVQHDESREIRVVMEPQGGTLIGELQGSPSVRASSYHVIAMRLPRQDGALHGLGVARPSLDGRFRLEGLLPGEYAVGVAADITDAETLPVDLLDALMAQSVRVIVKGGDTTVLNLKTVHR